MIDALLLWTVIYAGVPTVLQYRTEQQCHTAIAEGLPYLNMPPASELSCELRADQHAHQTCGDGSVVYDWPCQLCMRQGELVTSSLCEAHGYQGVR